eukprot:SAG11_NODE_9323_length_921_cov_7.238443_1_plen_94_part_10
MSYGKTLERPILVGICDRSVNCPMDFLVSPSRDNNRKNCPMGVRCPMVKSGCNQPVVVPSIGYCTGQRTPHWKKIKLACSTHRVYHHIELEQGF